MMPAKTIRIDQLQRHPIQGAEDCLDLQPGVNVLVGVPNTGKTKWLQMINYLLLSEDSPADAFGEVIAEKYHTLQGKLTVAGTAVEVERRWQDGSPKNRIHVNGTATTIKEFLIFLQDRLAIPLLHYPQGNPFGPRSWPELGWRSLYRHLYRRQAWWGDLADKQPESEQHACILQFCGLAEKLYSEEYGQLIKQQKRLLELQAQKENFLTTLNQVLKEMLATDEVGQRLPSDLVAEMQQRNQQEMDQLQRDRLTLIESLCKSVGDQLSAPASELDKLAQELAQLEAKDEQLRAALEKNQLQWQSARTGRITAQQELVRLERALKAGHFLAELKVTHCPACDREITYQPVANDCYLCHHPIPTTPTMSGAARLQIELARTKASLQESVELIAILEKDRSRLQTEAARGREQIGKIRAMLLPLRQALAAKLSPEISLLDMKLGQKQEQMVQMERITKSFTYQDLLDQEMAALAPVLAELEQIVEQQSQELDFRLAGERLQQGMNAYLQALNRVKPNAWTQKSVNVRLNEKGNRLLVGERKWTTQLGGTLSLYFLLAYHYALMTFIAVGDSHFPGFLILDFPAELDGTPTQDTENFAIEPFVSLLAGPEYQECQVIAAGVAFENLKGVNRIEFAKVWA